MINMKKILTYIGILSIIISCSSTKPKQETPIKYKEITTNTKTKVSFNIENKLVQNTNIDEWREQHLLNSMIVKKINGRDVKILYVTDKIVLDNLMEIFKDSENVGIYYKMKKSNLGCIPDKNFDVLFLNSKAMDNFILDNIGLGGEKQNKEFKCSSGLIKDILLLPKNLIDVSILEKGDRFNLDFTGKIPISKLK